MQGRRLWITSVTEDYLRAGVTEGCPWDWQPLGYGTMHFISERHAPDTTNSTIFWPKGEICILRSAILIPISVAFSVASPVVRMIP